MHGAGRKDQDASSLVSTSDWLNSSTNGSEGKPYVSRRNTGPTRKEEVKRPVVLKNADPLTS